MRCKLETIVAVTCVSLFALGVPAHSKPSPNDVSPKRLAAKNIKANIKPVNAKNGSDPRAAAAVRPVRGMMYRANDEDSGALKTYTPAATMRSRPAFGWPVLVTEARKYMGTNPTRRTKLWCATFMNFVLAKAGYAGTGSDAAKSFASYGKRVSEPRIGAIAVLSRGRRGGHVGIVTGIDSNGNPIIISGNHGHRVGEGLYSRSRVIAYVMPTDQPQLARATPAGTSDAIGESIASPITELLAAINSESPRDERHEAQAKPLAEHVVPAEPPQRSRLVEQVAAIPRPPQDVPTTTVMMARAEQPQKQVRAPRARVAVDIFGRPLITR